MCLTDRVISQMFSAGFHRMPPTAPRCSRNRPPQRPFVGSRSAIFAQAAPPRSARWQLEPDPIVSTYAAVFELGAGVSGVGLRMSVAGPRAMLAAVSAAVHQKATRRSKTPATAPSSAGPTMEPDARENRTALKPVAGLSWKTLPLQTTKSAEIGM